MAGDACEVRGACTRCLLAVTRAQGRRERPPGGTGLCVDGEQSKEAAGRLYKLPMQGKRCPQSRGRDHSHGLERAVGVGGPRAALKARAGRVHSPGLRGQRGSGPAAR